MKSIRVVVADDHPLIRLGICNALQREPDIQIVGEATNGQQAIQLVETLQPDVFILDVQMPDMDGVAVARWVRAHYPHVNILVLSAYADDGYIFGMLAEGALGYLLKDDAVESVVSAVRAVAQAKTWLSPQVAGKVVRRLMAKPPPASEPDRLTER